MVKFGEIFYFSIALPASETLVIVACKYLALAGHVVVAVYKKIN